MTDTDFAQLIENARQFSCLDDADIAVINSLADRVKPRLPEVTDRFYARLQSIDDAAFFLEGRLESLKKTHQAWLERVFSGVYDEDYALDMYRVGEAHVNVRLPLEFMAGAMTLITDALVPILEECAESNHEFARAISAVNSVLGFSLILMQESYHATSLANALNRFLKVTGMSRELFQNLASTETD